MGFMRRYGEVRDFTIVGSLCVHFLSYLTTTDSSKKKVSIESPDKCEIDLVGHREVDVPMDSKMLRAFKVVKNLTRPRLFNRSKHPIFRPFSLG